jgi:hypothetical protein
VPDLPISDEAVLAAGRAYFDLPEAKALDPELTGAFTRAIQAFLAAEGAGVQKRMLYIGDEKVGKGRRLVTRWRPV